MFMAVTTLRHLAMGRVFAIGLLQKYFKLERNVLIALRFNLFSLFTCHLQIHSLPVTRSTFPLPHARAHAFSSTQLIFTLPSARISKMHKKNF